MREPLPNQPAPPNAGILVRLAIGHHWPGVGEPERSAKNPAGTSRHADVESAK